MSTGTDIYTFSDFMGIADEKRKAHLLDGVIVMESPASTRHEELHSSRALKGFRVDADWFKSDPLPKPMAILRKLLKQAPR